MVPFLYYAVCPTSTFSQHPFLFLHPFFPVIFPAERLDFPLAWDNIKTGTGYHSSTPSASFLLCKTGKRLLLLVKSDILFVYRSIYLTNLPKTKNRPDYRSRPVSLLTRCHPSDQNTDGRSSFPPTSAS